MNPFGAASVVGGRFRLIEPVRDTSPDGAWKAADELTGAEVAIKTLGVYLAGDAVAQARCRHAAKALLRLSGPGIAQVRDYGEMTQPGGRVLLYLARDLASGQTLDERLAGGPLAAGEALWVAACVAAALAAAHDAGMVHGHLVPANIVLGPAAVTVTDFGLPAVRDDHGGTGLSYLAPELGDGGPVSPAADMYALGVAFLACLAGIAPVTARPGPAAPAHGPAGPASAGAAEPVPPAIAALWASCLGPDPMQRPTAARAVVLSQQVLSGQPAVNGQAATAPTVALHPPGPAQRGPRGQFAARAWRAARGRTLVAAGAAAALITVAAVASLLVSSLGARPAAHISAVTGAPSARSPPSSGTTGGAPGTDGSAQPASPPVPSSPALPGSLPSASALAAIQLLGTTIRQDVANGQIRQDVGLDMDNLILPVMTQLASGQPAAVQQLVSTLRVKIATRLSENGLTEQAAGQLTSELGVLQRSAGGSGS